MRLKPLWRVSIRTTSEAEDAVSELLQAQFGQPASVHTDLRSGRTSVSVFLEARPAWDMCGREIRAALRNLSQCGLSVGQAIPSLTRIPPQDWAESWKHHFRPINIGSHLLIKPTWARRPARKGQLVVLLDPGLSFGTGQHPTTSFCLREVAARRLAGKSQSCLDLGTGSGILAIAAARLGYAPIEAWDFDPQALEAARSNAKLNSVTSKIRFRRRDLEKVPGRSARRFTLICANLISRLLLQHRRKLISRLQPGGLLVLAGILRTEFARIRRVYEAAGLRLIASRAEREWQSASFKRPCFKESPCVSNGM